ncbi:MAG: adenylosuccinate lyase, partial [Burkholderiales bacterium]
MRRLFAPESRLRLLVRIEAAVAAAQERAKLIPPGDAARIARAAKAVSLAAVRKREAEVGHELAAVVEVLERHAGAASRSVHLGLTSNDVLDSALALQLAQALQLLGQRLRRIARRLRALALRHAATLMLGRTHGQPATPITFGFKVTGWYLEAHRNLERLARVERLIAQGKLSGAVGNHAALQAAGQAAEQAALRELGLGVVAAPTQVVPRDLHAELVSTLALVAAGLERWATEVRNLQRPELGEVAEGVRPMQVGSSAMPHKQNPVGCERICGLARIVRSSCSVALENVALWHERDLTNSAAERVALPQAVLALDEMLRTWEQVLQHLQVDAPRMRRNLEAHDVAFSELVLAALQRQGWPRTRAHRHLASLAHRAQRLGAR